MDQSPDQKKIISVIIPAFNEEETIASVVSAIIDHPFIREVIVVDDGSRDKTAERAREAGASVITHLHNRGKAQAMETGVRATASEYLCFLDADVVGLDHEKFERIALPVLRYQYQLFVGIRARKTYWLNKLLRFFPIIGGERVLTRDIWLMIPDKYKRAFQIELAMNYFCKRNGKRMGLTLLSGMQHIIKEKKRGVIRGFWARLAMGADLVAIAFKLYVGETMRKHWEERKRAIEAHHDL